MMMVIAITEKGEKKMSMRDYEDMKDIVIPKEQEEMMNIICESWEECHTLKNCKECHDRPKEYMRMMMCTSLKYTRKLLENGYSKRGHGHWIPENDRPCSTKWICSECHEIAYNKQRNGNQKICTLKFCPYCGAKMDGKE